MWLSGQSYCSKETEGVPESLKTGVGCSFYLGSSEHEAWPAASSPRRKRKARGRAWREAIQRTPPWLQTMASKTWSESPSTRLLARPQELDVVALRQKVEKPNEKHQTTNDKWGTWGTNHTTGSPPTPPPTPPLQSENLTRRATSRDGTVLFWWRRLLPHPGLPPKLRASPSPRRSPPCS